MKKILFFSALFFGVLSAQAQEKVMKVQKKDGTSIPMRVAELKQISFLAADLDDQGLLLKTMGGEMAAVLFEANPVVTLSGSKLTVKSNSADAVEVEVTNIAEILFGQTTGVVPAGTRKDLACIMQESGVLLRGIPDGVTPRVYSLDGRSLATPAVRGSELQLNRAVIGRGIFIVKVGTFSTKIKL